MAQEIYDIFISYSRKDTAIADQICEALDSVGITYFIDRQGIGIGDKFVEVIIDKIDNSRYFLLLASENAYNARYTPKEIHYAINYKSNDSIIPYIIDNAPIPKVYEFLISDTNYLSIDQCPIETTFIDNLLKKLGREREKKVVEEVKAMTATAPHLTDREKFLLGLSDDKFKKFNYNDKWGFKLESTEEILIPAKYDFITYGFHEGLSSVVKSGCWGFIDKTGNEIIPFKYGFASRFSEGLACVQYGGWGFIDMTGKNIIPFKYEDAHSFGEGLAGVKLNSKWGFINKHGEVAIPFIYDNADSFNSVIKGFARVTLNGKDCFIDKTGIRYGYDGSFSLVDGMVHLMLNGKHVFIDQTTGKVIPLKYNAVGYFSEGLCPVELNGKWGYIDKTGKEVIALRYNRAFIFRKGKGLVKTKNMFGVEKEFYIDKNGNRVEE